MITKISYIIIKLILKYFETYFDSLFKNNYYLNHLYFDFNPKPQLFTKYHLCTFKIIIKEIISLINN